MEGPGDTKLHGLTAVIGSDLGCSIQGIERSSEDGLVGSIVICQRGAGFRRDHFRRLTSGADQGQETSRLVSAIAVHAQAAVPGELQR